MVSLLDSAVFLALRGLRSWCARFPFLGEVGLAFFLACACDIQEVPSLVFKERKSIKYSPIKGKTISVCSRPVHQKDTEGHASAVP